MELKRKPFEGVLNIVRFNWHFYLIASIVLFILIAIQSYLPTILQILVFLGLAFSILSIIISLLVSYYVYDLSDLYKISWLKQASEKELLNINAGFDETSKIIQHKFSKAKLTICDFYNPEKHTEVSIKRARKAYPPNPKTIAVSTNHLPFAKNTFDKSLAILSAHEIRDEQERILFFKELNRITKSSGEILVTEHLRDMNNFLAYNIGFLHFHSRKSWENTFTKANLSIKEEIKSTPFITTFILQKNGNTF